MSDIDKIISAINPDMHYKCESLQELREFKNLIKKEGLDSAIKLAKPKASEEFKLVYDSSSETLEPVYFWILDFMNEMFRGKTEKLIDNFASSPGSGHFSELGVKASQMQQEASRVLGTVNSILKGVINILYDLKEFQIRLSHYEEAESKDKSKAESGLLALKQIWIDKVDMQKGGGSINMLASGNLNFVTLRDAFMVANSEDEVEKLDLNERVKRILKARIQEFLKWKEVSYTELKKRFEIEKSYLKSQVNALKLNAKWAKPYLKAAQQLTMSESMSSNPALVTVFNTVILELTLMGINEVKKDEPELPKDFKKIKNIRHSNAISIIDFSFRGIPNKIGQHYAFGGRVEVNFKAYVLNDDELKLFKDKLSQSDLNDALKLVQGMTEESLEQINVDLDEFLGEKKEKKEKKSDSENTNPFSALLDIFRSSTPKKPTKEEEKKFLNDLKEKGIKPDNYVEKYIRNLAEAKAINQTFTIYDIYKKSHGMASFPYREEASANPPETEIERIFGLK